MQVNRTVGNKGFRPVCLELLIESGDELKALYCAFNWYPMTSFLDCHLKGETTSNIRAALGPVDYSTLWDEMEANINKTHTIK